MAFPPGLSPKTVTIGIASFFDGTIANGRATISAPVNVLHTPSNRPIFSSEMTTQFVDGVAQFTLLPTDAPGLNRVDWVYKAKIEVSGASVQPEVLYFTLPTAGPDTVDLDGLVTVPSSAGVPIAVDVLSKADFAPSLLTELNNTASATSVALRAAFGSGGTPLKPVAAVSASGALVGAKHNPVDATGAVRTMTLPTGQTEGTLISVEKADAGGNAVAVTGNIRGAANTTINLTLPLEAILLAADASGSWWPIAGHKTKAALDIAYAKNPGRVILGQDRLDSSSSTQVSGGSIGRAYQLADAANTWVGGTVDFPADWHTVNVDAWVVPLAAATGNVVLQFGSLILTDGALTTANPLVVAAVTVPLPAVAFTAKLVRVAANLAVDPSGPMYLRVLRLGNDAGDTSTQAISIVRLDVTKAS